MQEREVVDVRQIDGSRWREDTPCMRSDDGGHAVCSNIAEREIAQTYDDESGKTFYTLMCASCASEYLKKWDHVQIFGE